MFHTLLPDFIAGCQHGIRYAKCPAAFFHSLYQTSRAGLVDSMRMQSSNLHRFKSKEIMQLLLNQLLQFWFEFLKLLLIQQRRKHRLSAG
ncbi:hypothetical protein SDC9_194655 [bioreactor metagenome]|uniref:Uncharacterized protein n=1 Tax=bioreactor metagenome TaxID=1076179 RepID=A0A645I6W2_9ZZZZ